MTLLKKKVLFNNDGSLLSFSLLTFLCRMLQLRTCFEDIREEGKPLSYWQRWVYVAPSG